MGSWFLGFLIFSTMFSSTLHLLFHHALDLGINKNGTKFKISNANIPFWLQTLSFQVTWFNTVPSKMLFIFLCLPLILPPLFIHIYHHSLAILHLFFSSLYSMTHHYNFFLATLNFLTQVNKAWRSNKQHLSSWVLSSWEIKLKPKQMKAYENDISSFLPIKLISGSVT